METENQEVTAERYINHVCHEHPLTLREEGYGNCTLCYQNISDGPSYGCTETQCTFHVHKSCGELPQEIFDHPFHSLHPHLTLQKPDSEHWHEASCKVCDFLVHEGFFYICENNCSFRMHIECASLKPNVEYQGHRSHLLIVLDNNISKNFQCEACRSVIKSPLCACCVVCNIRFHLQCGLASLSPSINLPEHYHHLFLTVSNLDRDDNSFLQLYRHVCQKETIKQNCPFYSCAEPECDYNAHACCVIPEVQVDEIIEKRIHFSDKHYLTLLKNDRIINGYVFLQSMRKCYPRCRPSIWLRSL